MHVPIILTINYETIYALASPVLSSAISILTVSPAFLAIVDSINSKVSCIKISPPPPKIPYEMSVIAHVLIDQLRSDIYNLKRSSIQNFLTT